MHLRTMIVVLAVVALVGIAALPSASAAPPGLCDLLNNTMCHVPGQIVADAKEFVNDNDPRDWPCTCDPMPNPGP